MKAITVQQPWAWAIFHGKNIENRTQLWGYRGPLAIHAGARWSERGEQSDLVHQAIARTTGSRGVPVRVFLRPAILGVVELVDCHPDVGCCRPWGESAYTEHGGRERRHVTHLVFENPRELSEPIPCRGALGLWTPPADILDQLQAVANA
jgi:hypothetical protein